MIPSAISTDHAKIFSKQNAEGLFYTPENQQYLESKVWARVPQFPVEPFAKGFRLPFLDQYKFRDQKQLLAVYNEVFIHTMLHVACSMANKYKNQLPNHAFIDETGVSQFGPKYGITEKSFENGFYDPLDYIYNNKFNKEPAWSRNEIDLRTNRYHEYKKAIFGPCVEEAPAGVPFWRWAQFVNKWQYDPQGAQDGLVQGGQTDRFISDNKIHYTMDYDRMISSIPNQPLENVEWNWKRGCV